MQTYRKNTLGLIGQGRLRIFSVILALSIVGCAFEGFAQIIVSNLQTDANGVQWYQATSPHNGPDPTTLRVLVPTNPTPGVPHRFIYVLPVDTGVQLQSEFGDGMEELRTLDIANAYNATIIAPSFTVTPWYGNHSSDTNRQYETFLVQDLVPWVRTNLAESGHEEHWLLGFSKSGFGAVNLLFRNPSVFNFAAAWDFPAGQPDASIWGMLDNYGTEDNFQNNYRLTDDWILGHKQPFVPANRLWLSQDFVTYQGTPTFHDEVMDFAARLQAQQVQFLMGGGADRIHAWFSGWVPEAVAGLQQLSVSATNSAQDNFNRADGDLGSSWTPDPNWTGAAIAGGQVVSMIGNGGVYYWNANNFSANQYSQIRIAGDLDVWNGVIVRGSDSPSESYIAAVKSDGAYLYAFVNNGFYQLAQDSTGWSTGDTLKLSVETINGSTAHLVVYRNGSPVITYDDSDHFIAAGEPGIGVFGSSATSIDDWEGGNGVGTADAPVTDYFDRPDVASLGSNWTNLETAPLVSIVNGQATLGADGFAVARWSGGVFSSNQFAQLTLKHVQSGGADDIVDVTVRGSGTVGNYDFYGASFGPNFYFIYRNQGSILAMDNTQIFNSNDVVRLEVSGNTLTVKRNGITLTNIIDGTLTSGAPGFNLYRNLSSLPPIVDNWSGGNLNTAPNQPPFAVISVDQALGQVPLTVHFDATASSDPDAGDSLSYAWDFDNNGQLDNSNSPLVSHTFTTTGSHTVILRVTDNHGAVTTASVLISVSDTNAATVQDGFNRANGDLGSGWTPDPNWTGATVLNNQVVGGLGNGGVYYRSGTNFAADQYSQIRITGDFEGWTGVTVRGGVSPSQSYILAVKSDGAYLYAFVNNAFYQLAYDPTLWSAGDTLKLSVQTVASSTARLVLYRNGNPLFTYDDSDHFIAAGQPGIGLFGSSATSLDDWEGGNVIGVPDSPAADYFDGPNSANLGINWTNLETAPLISAINGQAVLGVDGFAVGRWTGGVFSSNQFAQITLKHVQGGGADNIVDVTVRGSGTVGNYDFYGASFGPSFYFIYRNQGSVLAMDTTQSFNANDVVRLEVSGNTLTVKRNGITLTNITDTVLTSGAPGFNLYRSFSTTAPAADNWLGGNLPVAP